MFVVRTNVALRISDLLSITWDDVLDENEKFKILTLKEGKTQKIRNIKLNQASRKALEEFLETLDTYSMAVFIFKSREGGNKPISRQQALSILKEAAEAVGVKENIGTHSLKIEKKLGGIMHRRVGTIQP